MMDFRNAVFNAYGTIDCEIDHPVFGWVPFTASPDDAAGAEIYAAAEAEASPYVAPTEDETLAAWRATATATRTSFCIAAHTQGILTDAEAIAAARGDWPASLDGALAGLSAEEQVNAKITWAAAQVIRRADDLVQLVAAFLALTPEQLDALFQ